MSMVSYCLPGLPGKILFASIMVNSTATTSIIIIGRAGYSSAEYPSAVEAA